MAVGWLAPLLLQGSLAQGHEQTRTDQKTWMVYLDRKAGQAIRSRWLPTMVLNGRINGTSEEQEPDSGSHAADLMDPAGVLLATLYAP